MARYTIEDTTLTGIADAIREKTGKSGQLLPSQMPNEIKNIQAGGDTSNDIDAFIEGTLTNIVTNATKTRSNCFYQSTSLVSADFYKVKSLGSYTFRNCSSLVKVIIRTESVCRLVNVNAFTGTPIEDAEGYIYVPDELVEKYKIATNWSTYANQIKPMSEL